METNTHLVLKKRREQDRKRLSEVVLGSLRTGQGQYTFTKTNLRHKCLTEEGDYK